MILLDSNIVIYAADSTRTDAARFVAENQTAVSAISYVEALGFHDLNVVERQTLEAFFDTEPMFPIDPPVLDRAVTLRQRRRMSLGDAIIAATALEHDLPLATNDLHGFREIPGLRIVRAI